MLNSVAPYQGAFGSDGDTSPPSLKPRKKGGFWRRLFWPIGGGLIWILLFLGHLSNGGIAKSTRYWIKAAKECAGLPIAPYIGVANVNDEKQVLRLSVDRPNLIGTQFVPASVLLANFPFPYAA
jgi:hypothetical protein